MCERKSPPTVTTAPRRSPPPPPLRSPPPPLRSPPPPPFTPPLQEPGFDYFFLSLRWPNAFCELPGNTCDPSPPKQYFTIHGLWQQKYFHILPAEFCRQESPMTLAILAHYGEELLEFWPRLHSADDFGSSLTFWYKQWLRYGSCSSKEFPPESYIDKTITLGSTYGPLIMDELEAAGIEPNEEAYNWETILEAVKEATGKEANLACEEDSSGTLLLHEIHICIEADAETPMNCGWRYTPDKYRTDLVFASPPPSSLSTPL
ncbi:hypothetical protein L6164_028643 [Bauhinia variegata]|uniref:Uncharacterized protein n=1 Tax=Bauhinia variegata TaxID=167791 RepID=A0ACB9L6F4_BAUVA|nr:hypothetical protein L6164_028643 [Bauhinia variegata]